jgi:hypothetical protein
MSDEKVTLEITRDEAIVLYEWLAVHNKKEDLPFEDQAEQRVLWDVEAMLEKELWEPLSNEYDKILARARENTRDSET